VPDTDERGREPGEDEIDRALGEGSELPLNRPAGLLGEHGIDWRKADGSGPSIFGGVTQEMDVRTVWLGMIVAYLVFFPLAYVILWREPRFSRRTKVVYSIAFAAGVALVAYLATVR
jgi:hypothetical protein